MRHHFGLKPDENRLHLIKWSVINLGICFALVLATACNKVNPGGAVTPAVAPAVVPPALGSVPGAVVPPAAAVPGATTPPSSAFSLFPQCAGEENELDNASIKITAFDIIVSRGSTAPVTVQTKIEKRRFFGINPDLKNTQVQFQAEGTAMVRATTDSSGIATTQIAAQAGTSGFTCMSLAVENQVGLERVYAIEPTAPVIVIDIDEVISALKLYEVPLKTIQESPAVVGAAEALTRLAKTNRIIYLTARDDSLFNKTRAWLAQKSFPRGPLLVWNWTLGNGLGALQSSQESYKETRLKALKLQFPGMKAGVGNQPSDAQAYIAAGMKAVILGASASNFATGTQFAANWTEIEAALNKI